MTADRITKIRIEGLRVFERVQLDMRGMNVLIGDNGTGKSTLLEAFELLRRAGVPGDYAGDVLNNEHGPFTELLRTGADRLRLGVQVEGAGPKLDYSFAATLAGTSCVISEERLDVYERPSAPQPLHALSRTSSGTQWFNQAKGALESATNIPPQFLAAVSAAQGLVTQEAFVRLSNALQAIEYHPPFDVRPLWQQRELQARTGPRWPSSPDSTVRVRRYGNNLPAALLVLRNRREAWERLLTRARAAVGIDLIDVSLDPVGAAQLDVVLNFRPPRSPLPLRALSEGQLSYFALLVAVELGGNRGLLALDEPDIHYHPDLVVNLAQILEDVARGCPVVIATHSDRFLDALERPADSVLLCDLAPDGSVALRRPNADALERWLARYRGLGAVRAEGYTAHVFDGGPSVGTEHDS